MGCLTREPINVSEGPTGGHKARPYNLRIGASVLFLGTVRDHSEDKEVLYLEYEAYEEMAERLMAELVACAFRRWTLEEVRLLHRLGRVALGEIAVAIEVHSAHRDEAYQASSYLIEEIKHRVPIWKKEYFTDGTHQWSACQSVDPSTKTGDRLPLLNR